MASPAPLPEPPLSRLGPRYDQENLVNASFTSLASDTPIKAGPTPTKTPAAKAAATPSATPPRSPTFPELARALGASMDGEGSTRDPDAFVSAQGTPLSSPSSDGRAADRSSSPAELLAREMRRLSLELGSLSNGGAGSGTALREQGQLADDLPIYSENELTARAATLAHAAREELREEMCAIFAEERKTFEAAAKMERNSLQEALDLRVDEAVAASRAEEKAREVEALEELQRTLETEHQTALESARREHSDGPQSSTHELEEALAEQQAENAQLLEVFAEVEKKVGEMEGLEAQLDQARRDLEEKKLVINASLSQHHYLQQQLDAARSEAASKLSAALDDTVRLETRVSTLEAEMVATAEAEEERRRQAVVDAIERVQKQAKDQFAQAKKTYQTAVNKSNALKESLVAKEAEAAALHKELEELRRAQQDQHSSAARAAKAQEEAIARQARELATLRQRCGELDAKVADGAAALEVKEAALQEAKAEQDRHRAVMQSFWKEAEQLRSKVDTVTSERDTLIADKEELQRICEETIALMEAQQG